MATAEPVELGQLSSRRGSRSGGDFRPSAFQITPLDGDEPPDDIVAAASGVDVGVTTPSRRPSRSDPLRPAFGITPLLTMTDMDAVEAEPETEPEAEAPAATPTESLAKRRQSRSQSFKDLQPPSLNFSNIKPLETPPADGLVPDPFAPVPGGSLPPTPNEGEFDLEMGTPSDAGMITPGADTDREFFTSLPPVDRGRGAYLFLLASTVLEAAVWGLPFSVGVLHDYWSTEMFGSSNAENTLTLASTLPTGLLFFSGALLGPFFATMPWYERHIQYAGVFLATVGLLTSAFVNKLVLTFGILYPCSAATYLPLPTNLFEWYQARRGFATGIMYAGTGIGGTVYPFVVTALLKRFGYRATMLSLAVSFVIINLAALPFARRRIPIVGLKHGESKRHERPKIDWTFLRRRAPWAAFTFMLVTSLSNFIPLLWLPSFASQSKVTPDGATLVAITNATTSLGLLMSGFLSDRMAVRTAVMIQTTVATVVVLVFWGLGTSAPFLTTFAIMWGLTGGALAGYWGKIITIIARDDPTVNVVSFAAFMTLKGVGSLTSGPISNRLLAYGAFRGAPGAYGGTNYAVMIVFTAVMTCLGGWALAFFPKK